MMRSARWRKASHARAVHRSLSWFKSRPGLQPSLLRSFGSASHPAAPQRGRPTELDIRQSSTEGACTSNEGMPVAEATAALEHCTKTQYGRLIEPVGDELDAD